MMKIVFTLGPASEDHALIRFFCQVAHGFRLNVAHLSPEKLRNWLNVLTHLYSSLGYSLPVVLDLQGAKMRVGRYPTCEQLPELVTLFLGDYSQEINRIPIPHARLLEVLQVGDILLLNDARIQLQVTQVAKKEVIAKVMVNGPLSAYKGINRADHPIPFTQLIESDQQAVEIGLEYPFTQFAHSFVLDGQEAPYLRTVISNRHLIAKLERPETLSHLQSIDSAFDELWFCRGDMGSQVGLKALGPLQAEFVQQFKHLTRPKLLAGQVLEHLTHFPEPTRTEVVHLYDVMKAGFDGIVLSDETAVGKYPGQVAKFIQQYFGPWSEP